MVAEVLALGREHCCGLAGAGMLDACRADGGPPYAKSLSIFKQALTARAGSPAACPDVPPPAEAD
eukprot:m.252578 g.252578  ORF g.252578 m.252578 type:complete len:65 (+) comp19568_c0_seq1:1983-2177(+)